MAAWARFERYVPRDEPPDGFAGGKVARLDRVEWHTIPDPATAIAAVQRGEMDWLEVTLPDLTSRIGPGADVLVTAAVPMGSFVFMRFNALHPPFDDVMARQAVLHAVDQQDYLAAMVGDAEGQRICRDMFPCGTGVLQRVG